MKANKKAILGMMVAMVMSLGVMGGINAESNDSSLQQVGFLSNYISSNTESSVVSMAHRINSIVCFGAGGAAIIGGLSSNPIGWTAIGVGVVLIG